jgi:branched-chain amino acid transport system permease protein
MFTQQLINGLALGAVYALIALGYTMVYGILQLINFAHGEVYMLGAYLGIIVLGLLTATGLPAYSMALTLFITILVSMIFCAAYGAAIERVAYRPLRRAVKLAPLISAVGMSIILQNFVMLSQGKEYKNLPPLFPSEGFTIFGANVSPVQVFILGASILLMIVLTLFIAKTRIGKAMRATSQDRVMAGLVGININQVISVTFMIGSALAAVAGVMVTLYYGVAHFFMGYLAGIKAFTAAVLGGIGSTPGAMLGGFMLGLIENFGASYVSSVYKDAFAFLILIITLIIRPSGLLGQKSLDKV